MEAEKFPKIVVFNEPGESAHIIIYLNGDLVSSHLFSKRRAYTFLENRKKDGTLSPEQAKELKKQVARLSLPSKIDLEKDRVKIAFCRCGHPLKHAVIYIFTEEDKYNESDNFYTAKQGNLLIMLAMKEGLITDFDNVDINRIELLGLPKNEEELCKAINGLPESDRQTLITGILTNGMPIKIVYNLGGLGLGVVTLLRNGFLLPGDVPLEENAFGADEDEDDDRDNFIDDDGDDYDDDDGSPNSGGNLPN